MQEPIPRESTEAFASLAQLVYTASSSEEVLDAICRAAVEIVPGADHACISTLEKDRQLRTRAASDEVARLMDRLESEAQEGPCLDSIIGDSVQRDEDIASSSTWPALAELTLSRNPSMPRIGVRLSVSWARAGHVDDEAMSSSRWTESSTMLSRHGPSLASLSRRSMRRAMSSLAARVRSCWSFSRTEMHA